MDEQKKPEVVEPSSPELPESDLDKVIGGDGKSKVTLSDFHVTKKTDVSSPALFDTTPPK